LSPIRQRKMLLQIDLRNLAVMLWAAKRQSDGRYARRHGAV
jgi:hypothetical protein